MTTLQNVARYHLVDRITYVALPWGTLAFSFLVNLVIASQVAPDVNSYYTGGLLSIYVFLLICGALSMTRSLPFALMLGLSRRSYYLGTALLVVCLGIVYGLALAVLQVIERATEGWGVDMHFFRIPGILDGPWYLTWLTSFVLLVLFFLYGMWYGLVYRRWSLPGLAAFLAGQVLAGLVVAVVVTLTDNWNAFGSFFGTTLTLPLLLAVLAAAAALLGLGGFTTLRRAAI